ncbi:MAG: hypothetical protein MJZ16_12010 [Bacteroidales bacterium]|nr:hypothetical protein [Bacteroidales bacterium]
MKSNVVSVLLWGKEISKLQWKGCYKERFGKVGALVSFNPEYHKFGFDVTPRPKGRKKVGAQSGVCTIGQSQAH